jgi:hypothetical protein
MPKEKPYPTSSPPWGWGPATVESIVATVRQNQLRHLLEEMQRIGVPALAPTGSPPKPKEPIAKGKAKTPIPFCKHLRGITKPRGRNG